MEFYKIFCIIHRRTDWNKLYQWQRECMFPEIYEERRKRSKESIRKLIRTTNSISRIIEGEMIKWQ